MPSASRPGSTSRARAWYCCSTSWRTVRPMWSSWSLGGMRSAPKLRWMPACTFCCRPPTRTMKNSSRLELTMARNLSRSSSGTSGSWASSRTRRLNSSQLNSRLMYSDGSSRETAVGAITACMRGPPFACTRYCNTNPGRASSSHPGGTDLQLAPAPSLMKPGRTFPEERMGNPTPRRAHGLRPVGPATVLLVALLAPLACQPGGPSPPSTTLPGGTPAVSLPDLFEDRTAESGIDFTYHNGEEADHGSMLESLGGGVALLDYDGDGLLDVFLTGGGYFDGPDKQQIKGLPCRLYKNLGGWRFRDVTREAGLDGLADGQPWFYNHGAAVADYDNDGCPDLLVTGWGRLALFHNEPDGNGGRRFADVTAKAGLLRDEHFWSTGAAWGDLDGDGYPDLYVCQYLDWSFAKHPACSYDSKHRDVCSPKAFGSRPHALYRNAGAEGGDGRRFVDVSGEAGLRVPPREEKDFGKGLGVVFGDVNADGRPDVYVANDTTDNFLYLNDSTPGQLRLREV